MFTRNLIALIYIILSLCDDVQLLPRRCSCHGGICNCSRVSVPEYPFHHTTNNTILSNSVVNEILPENYTANNNCNSGMRITSINLDDNFFAKIEPSAFENISCVEYLSICNNSLQELNPLVFISFLQLNEIHLCWNRLVKLNSELFTNNYNLEIVDISNNRLKCIPSKIFDQNLFLMEVHLNDNELEFLHSDTFRYNPKLKSVDISNNKITFMDLVIFEYNTELQYSNFSNNEIKLVESRVYDESCPSEYFDISNNKLSTSALCQIHCAKEPKNIDISNNSLSCDFRYECKTFGSSIVRLCVPKNTNTSSSLNRNASTLLSKNVKASSRHTIFDNVLDFVFSSKTSLSNHNSIRQADGQNSYEPISASLRRKRQDYTVPTINVSEFSSNYIKNNAIDNTTDSSVSSFSTPPFLNTRKSIMSSIYVSSTSVSSMEEDSTLSMNTPSESAINDKILSGSTETSDLFLSSTFMYDISFNDSGNYSMYSEDFDTNVTTTVIPLFEYDSPLILRESTMRGFMFIAIECSVASVLVLRKVICMRDKRRPTVVETVELLSEPECRTNRSSSAEERDIQTSSV